MKRLSIILAIVAVALLSYAALSNYRASALNDAPLAPANPTTETLTAQLRSDDPVTRASAANALRGSQDRASTTALLANLGDRDPSAGYYTARALQESNDPSTVPALIAALGNQDPAVRQRAALALSQMNAMTAVPALSNALNDSATSFYAAQALMNIDGAQAQDALLAALADEGLTTRRHAVMAAIEQGDPGVAEALIGRALSSSDSVLVRNATQLRDILALAND